MAALLIDQDHLNDNLNLDFFFGYSNLYVTLAVREIAQDSKMNLLTIAI